jgi:hypothetical protein
MGSLSVDMAHHQRKVILLQVCHQEVWASLVPMCLFKIQLLDPGLQVLALYEFKEIVMFCYTLP